MAVFAISDLHLPGHNEKPMDIFGNHWQNHFEIIRENWMRLITPDDAVLIAGDISWAMQLDDAMDDLTDIAALPGKKVLLRGNHDYWWSSVKKIRDALPQDMYIIQNDAIRLDRYVICGTRGWTFPTATQTLSEQDQKIYRRELLRLEMTLKSADKLGGTRIVMTHFPPLLNDVRHTEVTERLEAGGAEYVVYGHLHGVGIKSGFTGESNGVRYALTSCDAIDFCPVKICD